MQVLGRMSRWLPAGIFALIFLLVAAIPVNADTGTYRISNYMITLEPQSNGQVKITCEQEWEVLSGNIPWITVGLPNSNFSVVDRGGAASKVSAANSGGFSGVRVDLDKDYQPGQAFQVKLVVLQGNLLERLTSEKKWRINYTPGWYDNAVTDHLQINLVSPVDFQSYSLVKPMPTAVNNNVITWEISNLSAGSRFNITVESTDGGFLTATAASPSQSSGLPGWVIVVIIIAVVFIIYGLIALAVRRNRQTKDAELKARVAAYEKEMAENKDKKKEIEKGFEEYVEEKGIKPDEQGRYYDRGYGNYITPAIWAAVILSHQGQPRTPGQPGQGSSSCACACVACACACACACAGGGAAGCSKKTIHRCPECAKLEAVD